MAGKLALTTTLLLSVLLLALGFGTTRRSLVAFIKAPSTLVPTTIEYEETNLLTGKKDDQRHIVITREDGQTADMIIRWSADGRVKQRSVSITTDERLHTQMTTSVDGDSVKGQSVVNREPPGSLIASALDPGSNCLLNYEGRSPTNAAYLRSELFMTYEVVVLQERASSPGEAITQRETTLWRAPALNCAALKTGQKWYNAEGLSRHTRQAAVAIGRSASDFSAFVTDAAEYPEMPPADLRALHHSFVLSKYAGQPAQPAHPDKH